MKQTMIIGPQEVDQIVDLDDLVSDGIKHPAAHLTPGGLR